MNIAKNFKIKEPGVYIWKNIEFTMNDMTKNGRTVKENIINGYKSAMTKKLKMIDIAKQNNIEVENLINDYLQKIELFENDYSVNGILAKELSYVCRESFERYGDKNYIDKDLTKYWIRKNGLQIDTFCQEINEMYYSQITPDDVIEFIVSNPLGCEDYNLINDINEANKLFKELVGFSLSKKLAKDIITLDTQKLNNIQNWNIEIYEAFGIEILEECPF